MNKELNPQVLVEELGWTYMGDVPYDNAHPMSLYQRKHSDGWSDGYNYTWTLYVPPFNYFGTWRGVEFIIEEHKQGGFIGASKKYSIFRGRLNSVREYYQIVQMTDLKQSHKDDDILKHIIHNTKSF